MWTGPAALKNIDQTLLTVRNEVVRLDTQLSSLTDRLAGQERRRVQILKQIAAVRLAELEQGTLDQSLSSADHQAADLLAERQQNWQRLDANIDALNLDIEQHEQQRDSLLEKVNKVSQNILDKEVEVQSKLANDKNYLEQLEQSRLAESIAAEAEQKVADAQADMARKAEPYQQDKLFFYLWQRGFGTTEYKAGLFARFMDSWVAKLIKYEPARVNYWNLTEIPKRLQAHADDKGREADEQVMALQQIELDTLADAGVHLLESDLQQLREQIDQQDDELEDCEDELNIKLEQRSAYVSGQDEYMQQCLSLLANAMAQQSLRAVHRYAQVTHSPTDDNLVIELQDLQTYSQDLTEDLSDLRQLHEKQLKRLKEIEQVRRNFKNSRFDDVRSGFGDESLLAGVLAQFIQGVVSGSDVWRVIKRNQRYRNVGSLPDFGSGGFGNIGDVLGSGSIGRKRRQRKSSWHWPKPRRGGGGFNFPRGGGGRRSGGGFRTGGGF